MAGPEIAAAGNAPRCIVLHGVEYTITGLTWQDLGMFEQWMRVNLIEAARDAVVGMTDLVEKRLVLREAMKAASSVTFVIEDAMTIPMGGLLELARLALRKHHPKLTAADISTAFRGRTDLMNLVKEAMSMSGLLQDDEDSATARPTEVGRSAVS